MTKKSNDLKTINVVAALIEDGHGHVLTTQRAKGDLQGFWEFPGGKIEPGESAQEALIREIHEELDVEIQVGEHLYTAEHDYPSFHLSMKCFLASIREGSLHLLEHSQMKWISSSEVDSIKWAPADINVAKAWKAYITNKK